MQYYSYSRITLLTHHGLLTPKDFRFHNKKHIKYYFAKLQSHFSQAVFIRYDIFTQFWLSVCILLNMFH